MEVKNEQTLNYPWTEDPDVAYKKFLENAGQEVNEAVNYNRQVLTLFGTNFGTNKVEKKEEPKVHACNEAFYPLSTALSAPLYCSKITIRNVENANFSFDFEDDILPGILGIEANARKIKGMQIAYRNIVPSEFSQATQLAGPMGFHEYIINGSAQGQESAISFIANSNFDATPIKIVLENCKGSCKISGLDSDAIARIFDNKCAEKDFNLEHIQLSSQNIF